MEVLANATASISLPPSLLSDLQGGEEVYRDEAVQRLSYSVFLTDALFQSPNQTARNLSIGTIIVALRLRNVALTMNQTLTVPVNTTFHIDDERNVTMNQTLTMPTNTTLHINEVRNVTVNQTLTMPINITFRISKVSRGGKGYL